jgi:hypothetical protein
VTVKISQKKSSHKKAGKSHDNNKLDKNAEAPVDGDNPESGHTENDQNVEPRPKRLKRLMKSTDDDKEPAAAIDHVKLADEGNHTTHGHDDTEEQN